MAQVEFPGVKSVTVPYLLPSDQEEVYGRQVDAELLTKAHQQVPDGHAGPQRDRATRAVRQADVALPQGGAASSAAISRHRHGAAGNIALRESGRDNGQTGTQATIKTQVTFNAVFLKWWLATHFWVASRFALIDILLFFPFEGFSKYKHF